MKRITRIQAVEAIKLREPFKTHGALWARATGDRYEVVSYSTPIATWFQKYGTWDVNATKYSRTTSRHQNIVRRAIG